MKTHFKIISILFFLFASTFSSAFAQTNDCQSFVTKILDYGQKNIPLSQKKEFLLEYVDAKFITKFVLGSNWRTLTPEQRKEFFDVYSKYVVYKYAIYLGQYKSVSYKIISVDSDKKRPNICNAIAVVTTKVNGQNTDIPLTGVISTADGKFAMQDIIFKNLSILQIQQQEISSLIKSEGYEKTIKILKDFIDSQK